MLNEVIEAFLDPLEAIFIQVSVAKANESSRSGLLLQKEISWCLSTDRRFHRSLHGMSQRLLLQFRLVPFSISPHTAKGRLKHLCAFLVPSLWLINYVLPQRGHREAQRFLELGLRPKPQTPNAIHSPTRAYLWYHTGMQSQRDRFSGMSDEQIAAALAQDRRTATDKIPIEELVTTVRQTAYALHLYLGTDRHRTRTAHQLRLAEI